MLEGGLQIQRRKKTYIFSLVLLLAQVVFREEVLVFSSIHVGVLTVCKTHNANKLWLQEVF